MFYVHSCVKKLVAAFGIAAAFGIVVGPASRAEAAGWSDDFNDGNATDGNPVAWIEDFDGFFPGDYNASSGDYVLTPEMDELNNSQMAAVVPIELGNVYIRTRGIVLPDPLDPNNRGGNLALLGRVNPEPETQSGYLLFIDVDGNLNLQILLGGETEDIGTNFVAPFNAGSEVFLELNIVGSQLRGYAWSANDPNGKPATPQVTATDDILWEPGIAGIAFSEDDDLTRGVFRYVQAQDTPFAPPSGGDFDADNDVDGRDFLTWQRGLGLTAQLDRFTGDADGDGDVDGLDLNVWRTKFGGPPAMLAAHAVPEAATVTLGLSCAGAFAFPRAGRNSRSRPV